MSHGKMQRSNFPILGTTRPYHCSAALAEKCPFANMAMINSTWLTAVNINGATDEAFHRQFGRVPGEGAAEWLVSHKLEPACRWLIPKRSLGVNSVVDLDENIHLKVPEHHHFKILA
jgi:hypothetical protein